MSDSYGYFGRIALYFVYLAFGAAIFLKTERPNEVELCAAAQNISNIYMSGKQEEIFHYNLLGFNSY